LLLRDASPHEPSEVGVTRVTVITMAPDFW